ncbi:T9SS type A sorting domain-containing protein [Flavobacterium ardleyense]|uniref:T9SS type A sorting domain-containing protein n=1 Tax=Flavobacterium ardleyense TaxID=2038737 RepID=A0ABW5Z8H4_9FLAO
MKKILFFFLCLSYFSHSQSVCDPNGVSTDPANPINPQNANFTNNFNWTTAESFLNINSTCMPNGFTSNPFMSNQTELLYLTISKDNKPEDGWEIIAYNLGYDNNNILLNVRPEHSYYMLYNKFTGTLRILAKSCMYTNNNVALLTLKFAPGFQTNLLDMSNDEKTLDMPHISNPSLSTSLKLFKDNNFWMYADFKLNYDPCTCSFDDYSRLLLYTDLISNSSIELTGKLTRTITSITGGLGSTNASGTFWKSATDVNNKMMTAHKGTVDFTETYKKIYKDLDDSGQTIYAINQLGSYFNNNAFMKSGLKSLPFFSGGVKFLTGLFGGGASGQQTINLSPMSVNSDVKISGTISTEYPIHNVTIGLPGSQKQNAIQGVENGQPLYTETLGVFSLINQPIMYFKEIITSQGYLNREKIDKYNGTEYWEKYNEYDFVKRQYKLSGETLKFAINPASKLELQDAEVMLITEYEKPSFKINAMYPNNQIQGLNMDTSNGLPIEGTDMGPIVDTENYIFHNSFKAIGANNYKNDYSFTFLYDVINKQGPQYNKKRRLKYNSLGNLSNRWKCYEGGSATNCKWTNSATRPFAYVQPKTDPTSPFYHNVSPNDFKNNVVGMPSGITPREEFLSPRIKQFKLKFILNLKRLDNPDAQNVLYVVTYPVKLVRAEQTYNMAGTNYTSDALEYANQPNYDPQVISNKFIPATQSELINLCANSNYTSGRSSLSGRINNLNEENKTENNNLVLYPVPVEDVLHFNLFNSKLNKIIDMNGKTVLDLSKIEIFEDRASVDVSTLAKGVYIISFTNENGELRHQKFVK